MFAASLMIALATSAQPDPGEQAVRDAVRRISPNVQIDSVASSVVPDFYEVVMGRDVVYVSKDGKYIFAGTLFDATHVRDLTEARRGSIRKLTLDSFGEKDRIRFTAPNEKYRVTVFTDVECGYCRRMHHDIDAYLAQGISIDYLFFPRTGPQTPAYDTAVSVVCADDRQAAFTRALGGETVNPASCPNKVDQTFKAALDLQANGTPSVYLADGRYVGGYLTPDQLAARLASLAANP